MTHGCMLSPLLFMLAIYWVLRRSMKMQQSGFKISLKVNINELDFENDMVLIAQTAYWKWWWCI